MVLIEKELSEGIMTRRCPIVTDASFNLNFIPVVEKSTSKASRGLRELGPIPDCFMDEFVFIIVVCGLRCALTRPLKVPERRECCFVPSKISSSGNYFDIPTT